MFGCCPRHHVRILVPERGDPTTKIGLFVRLEISFIFHIEGPYYEYGSVARILSRDESEDGRSRADDAVPSCLAVFCGSEYGELESDIFWLLINPLAS